MANPELIDQFGAAKDAYEKYAAIASEDSEKNKRDLIDAYGYLSYYHFSRKEDEKALENIDKLLALDPENESGLGMKEAIKAEVPTAPVNGGGKGKK